MHQPRDNDFNKENWNLIKDAANINFIIENSKLFWRKMSFLTLCTQPLPNKFIIFVAKITTTVLIIIYFKANYEILKDTIARSPIASLRLCSRMGRQWVQAYRAEHPIAKNCRTPVPYHIFWCQDYSYGCTKPKGHQQSHLSCLQEGRRKGNHP